MRTKKRLELPAPIADEAILSFLARIGIRIRVAPPLLGHFKASSERKHLASSLQEGRATAAPGAGRTRRSKE